jgi:hypothetical protein
MIPKVPVNNVVACPEEAEHRRRLLFQMEGWEIVQYKNYEKAYAVHQCRGEIKKVPVGRHGELPPIAPRAITRLAEVKKGHEKATPVLCWNCTKQMPDEIITILELFNAS